jgi:hypothetical protein
MAGEMTWYAKKIDLHHQTLWAMHDENGVDRATVQFNVDKGQYLDGKGHELGRDFNEALRQAEALAAEKPKGKKR